MRPLHVAFLALLVIAACGKGKDDVHPVETTGTTTPAQTVSVPSKPEPSEAPKPAVKVELQLAAVHNTMTFDKTTLTVPTGAEVHLVLANQATVATLPHNWVLVKPGTEASVALAGVKLDQAGYVDVRNHDMLAHTTQAKPGENAEVTFTAPAPGTYPYICTTPGHYLTMKGVLTVTP